MFVGLVEARHVHGGLWREEAVLLLVLLVLLMALGGQLEAYSAVTGSVFRRS